MDYFNMDDKALDHIIQEKLGYRLDKILYRESDEKLTEDAKILLRSRVGKLDYARSAALGVLRSLGLISPEEINKLFTVT